MAFAIFHHRYNPDAGGGWRMYAGMPGMPQLSDTELLEQTIQTAGSSVSRGKVRRKKEGARRTGRGGLAELTRLR